MKNKIAYRLLRNLEKLHIIQILGKEENSDKRLSEKYAGKLPGDIADKLQQYVTNSRNEWNKRDI